MDSNVIQIGIKALRTPSGEFLEAQPILIPLTPELAERERLLLGDIEQIQAKAVYNYIEAKKLSKNRE